MSLPTLAVHAFIDPDGAMELRADADDCPAHVDGVCSNESNRDGQGCQTFVCSCCSRVVPWCFGGSDDELCNDCWCRKDRLLDRLKSAESALEKFDANT